MEIMLETDIPTYAGGLGVLAGDLLRSCADVQVPAVGVSLVYSGNTFSQVINSDGSQSFKETEWKKMDQLTKLSNKINIKILGTDVMVGCWRYDIVGIDGFVVPVYLLDTDFLQNEQWARDITRNLYEGPGEVRLSQEVLLGIGGVKLLRNLGYNDVKVYHMNEGHAALVSLELLRENNYNVLETKNKCVFTTHTPVPEGHDKFNYDLSYKYAGEYLPMNIKDLATPEFLSMSHLALNMSRYSFGVSKKHEEVSKHLFPNFNIASITNGVHHRTWIGKHLQNLYDQYLPEWIKDPEILNEAVEKIPDDALWIAHQESKKELIDYVNNHLTSLSAPEDHQNPPQDVLFDLETMTISLARRPVEYKRPLLLYRDLERFIRIGVGKIQIIQCGKSHPSDDVSQKFVREIVRISKRLKPVLKIVYLENYSPKIARLLVSGSDVWLNTPRRPLEASGTSGMKAAMNGVLNFSVLDGWWIEGFKMCPEGGFSIGINYEGVVPLNHDEEDSNDLYSKLENEIIPLYHDHRSAWLKRMKSAITLGAYFNTHRCIDEYRSKAWKTV